MNDGGQAFPVDVYVPMTLRDYFAAKAMQGELSNQHSFNMKAEILAERAYHMADAMLKARENR